MSKWRSHARNEHQAGIKPTDDAFSLMIRERDVNEPCIACCGVHKEYQAGHYRRRELMPTRYHPFNVNSEGTGCNLGHVRKYGIKDMDLYRENIDKKWGAGTAAFLYKISQPIEPFTTEELEQMRHTMRLGYNAYCQFYKSIRPHHFPSSGI
jgi:hypothetical protein